MRTLQVSLMAIVASAVVSGCSASGSEDGGLEISVISSAVTVTSVQVVITGAGINPDITETLVYDASTETISGVILAIPPGNARTVSVTAFDGATPVCSGAETVDISAGPPQVLMMVLQCAGFGPRVGGVDITGVLNQPPQIRSVFVSSLSALPGQTLGVRVTAVDPDGDPLSYAWTGTCGTFFDPSDRDTTWTAPSAGPSCDLTITVSDDVGGNANLDFRVLVSGVGAKLQLASLTLSEGSLTPPLNVNDNIYTVFVGAGISDITLTPTAVQPAEVTITVDGAVVDSGDTSAPIALPNPGSNVIEVVLTSTFFERRFYYIDVRRGLDPGFPAYLKASSPAADAEFGHSLAADGDTLVIGAPDQAGSATEGGSVYVFTRSGTTWTQAAVLVASDTEPGDRFGQSVDIENGTIVVGAPSEDTEGNRAGAVYVFTGGLGTWSQRTILYASNAGPRDFFGTSVSLHNGTLAVGAFGEGSAFTNNPADNSAPRAGAVYVFSGAGMNWNEVAYLKASNPDGDDEFGFSVSLSGTTLAVGARREDGSNGGVGATPDNGLTDAGAVYIFDFAPGTGWTESVYIKAPTTQSGARFGDAVSLSGTTLVTGARLEDGVGANSGAVYVHERDMSGTWQAPVTLTASNAALNDQFGYSVAVDGDNLVVGALGEDSDAVGVDGDELNDNARLSGAAYAFSRVGATWVQQSYLKASNTGGGDQFGFSVCVDGDTLAVGARGEASADPGDPGNDAADDAGAAYVFP